MRNRPYWLLLLPLLAACTPAGLEPRPAAAPAAPTRPGENAAAKGMEGVIGKPAEALLALLGPASLDRTEADTRHLQFGGSPCILDIYLFPEAAGAPATARHVDARLIDGKDASAGECITRRLRDLEQERAGRAVS